MLNRHVGDSEGAGLTEGSASGGFGDSSTETIAGREAECVRLTLDSALGRIGSAIAGAIGGAKANQGTISCIDKQTGILLKYQIIGVDDDKSGIIAIEVGDPKDDDFSPSATTPTSDGSGTTDTTTAGETTTTVAGG